MKKFFTIEMLKISKKYSSSKEDCCSYIYNLILINFVISFFFLQELKEQNNVFQRSLRKISIMLLVIFNILILYSIFYKLYNYNNKLFYGNHDFLIFLPPSLLRCDE